jgi:hypothetical protein
LTDIQPFVDNQAGGYSFLFWSVSGRLSLLTSSEQQEQNLPMQPKPVSSKQVRGTHFLGRTFQAAFLAVKKQDTFKSEPVS